MGILIPLVFIFLTCGVIWRACDGFEIASEYAGLKLTEGVRDSLFLIAAVLLLIVILNGDNLFWWQSAVLSHLMESPSAFLSPEFYFNTYLTELSLRNI